MDFKWDDLDFWRSGEWQVIDENLRSLSKRRIKFNPKREDMFNALDATPFDKVKVMICGQDPYPNAEYATGIAFSIPAGKEPFPPTLSNIFNEYIADLHYPYPESGDLTKWCEQGVLLWNATPTCEAGKPASHSDWVEWEILNKEMIERLSEKGAVVFAFLGRRARTYEKYVDKERCKVIEVSHPSPLGIKAAQRSFKGSRLFSTINDCLVQLKQTPINWRL